MDDVPLSIVVTVVSGAVSLRKCLEILDPQVTDIGGEIIVPYDHACEEVGHLAVEFPRVLFERINDAVAVEARTMEHRRYDQRRAVGLAQCRGRIIAMTEDHAQPAKDWCRSIIEAHRQPYAVIGGVIDNGVDRALNWALYYCDFGRYGSPLPARVALYVSDVNISYKREPLYALREFWSREYHETTVNWILRERGHELFLDPRLVVFQARPGISFTRALYERVEWGRVFAETRTARQGIFRRIIYAAGTVLLPLLLTSRAMHHMRRQGQSLGQFVCILPVLMPFMIGWAWGELIGYLAPTPTIVDKNSVIRP